MRGRLQGFAPVFPDYSSGGVRFSKTGALAAAALCLISSPVSTFPGTTVTTTKKNSFFVGSFRSSIVHGIHRINARSILSPLRRGVE
jgi:hypothetical protein